MTYQIKPHGYSLFSVIDQNGHEVLPATDEHTAKAACERFNLNGNTKPASTAWLDDLARLQRRESEEKAVLVKTGSGKAEVRVRGILI